ncbi:MAG: hypothetical protein DME76_15305 [Verrucomicrobia bacterium]|nr:MAG: hypothetical protein DME76_15305 [Verrucomicrobiota bacterium]
MTIIAVLALAQSALGVLRTLHWFDAGSDLMGQGLLLFPLIGVVAFFRSGFVAVIAILYVVFAYGALVGRSWARWLGIVVAIVTLLLVVSVVIQGESPVRALVWSVAPVVMIWYLLSPAGRQATVN